MPVPTGFDLETLSPVEEKRLLVLYFLPKALTLAFALPLKQTSSSFSRLGPSRVTFPSLSLRNSMKATGYTYMTITTGYDTSVWRERMNCRYSWTWLEAKLGVPWRKMGSISRNVQFDFVVCL